MNFKIRDKEPSYSVNNWIVRQILKPQELFKTEVYLSNNKFTTYDNLFKSFFPSLEGSFYSLKKLIQQADFQVEHEIFKLEISLSENFTEHQREVYNLFTLLGDLGGVADVIISILSLFISPISDLSYSFEAISKFFSPHPTSFTQLSFITQPKAYLYSMCFCFFTSNKNKQIRKYLRDGKLKLEEYSQLDVVIESAIAIKALLK